MTLWKEWMNSSGKEKGIQLTTTDVIIAAAALEQGATLVTGNMAHYPMEELPFLSPPR
jgi:predicted nucleic acid-binding protein